MNKKVDKRQKSIKSKLMAAIAMLMVAAIMMVSTTYAWFTLSTAPEVTGITTAVGANGNLEMALMPTSGNLVDLDNQTTFNSLDGTDKNAANRSWGNLVDVSELYGLERISLLPSELFLQEGKLPVSGSMLRTPEYGSDGRVIKLQANTTVGVYDSTKTSFFAGTTPGVRALGVSSSMTPRKLALRNAISAAATYAGTAKTVASQSLSKNGGNLGRIAVEHYGTNKDEFTKQDAANMLKIASDLLGTADAPGALDYIDKAIGNYMVAVAASSLAGTDAASDLVYSAIQSMVDAHDSAQTIVNKLSTDYKITADSSVSGAITKLEAAKADVATAKSKLEALTAAEHSDVVTWTELYEAIQLLADVNAMEVAGLKLSNKGDGSNGTFTKDDLIDAVMDEYLDNGSVSLVLNTGSGVYSDIADLCSDYQATVVMTDISAAGITVSSVKAVMKTKTTQNPPFLTAMAAYATGLTAPDTGGDQMPMAEFYGYILDLAFRTNASASDLLLQTTPVDRIYDGEGTNETLGHGSTMTFTQANETVTNDMIKELMGCIRVVFFNPTDGAIYGEARLTDYVEEGTSVKGNIKLYKDDAFVTDESQAKLMTLTQNAATQMSVLVYLDGESVTNAKVANALSTMTGSMNLQFSSSATLVPMQYADLMGQAEKVETPDTPVEEGNEDVTP